MSTSRSRNCRSAEARMNAARLNATLVASLLAGTTLGLAQSPRPTPPTRDPHTPGYVTARELPDGAVPPVDADGNFIIGPTHDAAPDMTANDATPRGAV